MRNTLQPYLETVDSAGRLDALVAEESWRRYLMRNDSVMVDTFTVGHPFFILPLNNSFHERTTYSSRVKGSTRRTDNRFPLDDPDRSGKICMIWLMLQDGNRDDVHDLAQVSWVGSVLSL